MQRYPFTFRAMACDNICELYAGSHAEAIRVANAVITEVQRIEAKYSRYQADSIITKINRTAGLEKVEIDPETAQLLDFADSCYQQSGGLFDITSGVLRRVWNFKLDRPPSALEIASVLPLIGWDRVVRSLRPRIANTTSASLNTANAGTENTNAIFLPQVGMEIDFGGFGKEYAADRAAAVLLSYGIRHGFVNLGGDVVVTGPHANGEPWQLGIRHPRDENALLATFPIASGAVATSGDYERFIDFAGRRHSHILNPKTGESVQGLQCVTVFAPSCLVAGSISTIAMLHEGNKGAKWLAQCGARYLAVDADGSRIEPLFHNL